MSASVLSCENVIKRYNQGPSQVEVLQGVDIDIQKAQHVAIVGASGSGKSTLLNVLGGLDKPDSGTVMVLGREFSSLSDNQRGYIRNQSMGFVYQFHHLLPEFSALENAAMPLLIGGEKKREAYRLAASLLGEVGLESRVEHKPSELSGGERQRVAIARALVNSPACVLMDEPTGNLDSRNASSIQSLMKTLSAQYDTSFVVVTHDETLARTMDTVYALEDGTLKKQI